MDVPPHTQVFAERLQRGEVAACFKDIAQEGLAWWFEMDIPRIAQHLQVLQPHLPPLDPSQGPRLDFLAATFSLQLPETALGEIHGAALACGDHELAAAAAGAGCGAVWDSGYDFRRFRPWLERIDALLAGDDISPLARASLLGFKANAQMNGEGDLATVSETCRAQILAAEEAHSTSLRLFHAALQTYVHLWNGHLSAARVLLDDADYLSENGEAALIPQVFLHSSRGLFHVIAGEPERGRAILEAAVAQPFFEQLPPSLWLLVQANRLFAIANCGDHAALAAAAEKIQRRAVPEQNAFHHSFLHFSLGVAALGLGEPQRALAHADQAIERGVAAYSAVTARMPRLLKVQALADLGQDHAALALVEEWMAPWLDGGFRSVAATAAQEAARIAWRRGEHASAEAWLARARAAMPPGEAPVMFHRQPDFMSGAHEALGQAGVAATPLRGDSHPIRIHVLGELRVEVGERLIHDRQWRGGRAKVLLKALVVHGGRKIDMNRLADLLWPEAEGDSACRNLKVLVWRLRRLGLDKGQKPLPWLLIQHGRVSLSEVCCAVDVFDFEAGLRHALRQPAPDWAELRQALDRYAGDFLPSDNSETWIIEHRERLRRRFVEAVLVLAEVALDAASREASIPCLRRALEIDELDERLYQQLMHIHLALGYPAKALETYHAAQRALQRELAIAPGPALIELARQAGANHLH